MARWQRACTSEGAGGKQLAQAPADPGRLQKEKGAVGGGAGGQRGGRSGLVSRRMPVGSTRGRWRSSARLQARISTGRRRHRTQCGKAGDLAIGRFRPRECASVEQSGAQRWRAS